MEDPLKPLVRRFRELSAVRRGLLYAAATLCAVFLLVLLAPNRPSQSTSSHSAAGSTPFPPTDRFPVPAMKEYEAMVAAPSVSRP